MAHVSHLRPAVRPARTSGRASRLTQAPRYGRPTGRSSVPVALVVVAIVVVGGVLLLSSGASLSSDDSALAHVGMPFGGGKIESVKVVTGPHSTSVPVRVRGEQIWPRGLIRAGQQVRIEAVVKRPGWISWLTGGTDKLHLTLTTPSTSLREQYLTLRSGQPIVLRFREPIRTIAAGQPGQLQRRVLAHPRTQVKLTRPADAGTLAVAATPRPWEIASPQVVSWFPAGAAGTAVASPTPGSSISPNASISLTFSKPVNEALGSSRPPVSPTTPGSWRTVNTHTISFQPTGYGYGLGAKVTVALPGAIRLIGGNPTGPGVGTWTVSKGSPLRLQELLAGLHYLPLRFSYNGAAPAKTPEAQNAAALNPPGGHWTWRYPNIPPSLHNFWAPGSSGVMTQGALMAFQNDHGLNPDGVAGPRVWQALIKAAIANRASHFGYSYVNVSVGSQSLDLWHNGRHVTSTAVNTGISSRPTATGTYPVYEHIAEGTMSGTNPDGSSYNDPGIKWISYFNGGDALHAFDRASYGSPQSLGCVEMAEGPAGQVWPYTPIGTLVHVA